MDQSTTPVDSGLRDVVAEARTLAQEQISAAWQLYADRIRELLDSGWRADIDRIFGDRFAEIETRLERHVRQSTERAQAEFRRRELVTARESAAKEATELLHQ